MIRANYITTSEFQDMNQELDMSMYSDTTISGMIKRASMEIDQFLSYSLSAENIVLEANETIVTTNGNLMIYPAKFPILQVNAIQLKLGTAKIDLSLVDGNGQPRYDIPWRERSIIYPYQEIAFTGTLSIRNFYAMRGMQILTRLSYRAGFETIPDDVKDACSLWTRDMFIRQANPMDLLGMTQGTITTSFKGKAAQDDPEDSRWLKQAKSILQSYLRLTA